MPRHPDQKIVFDDHGDQRFRENAIVQFLLDNGGHDLNQLAVIPFKKSDRVQFAQLIGYSVSGFMELSYVSDKTADRVECLAMRAADKSNRSDLCGRTQAAQRDD